VNKKSQVFKAVIEALDESADDIIRGRSDLDILRGEDISQDVGELKIEFSGHKTSTVAIEFSGKLFAIEVYSTYKLVLRILSRILPEEHRAMCLHTGALTIQAVSDFVLIVSSIHTPGGYFWNEIKIEEEVTSTLKWVGKPSPATIFTIAEAS